MNFVADIQEKDDRFQNTEYIQKHKFEHYHSVDSIGQEILIVTELDANTQIVAWQKSKLKEEFLSLFPDYEEMKIFVKERTRGDDLQAKVLKAIDCV